ncbi:hypothetical protein BDR04DRAFT_776817 [Suillus decipiens]|nr:hypothetical protein BDR04DRAFT_776817 [Suillus decipiens]
MQTRVNYKVGQRGERERLLSRWQVISVQLCIMMILNIGTTRHEVVLTLMAVLSRCSLLTPTVRGEHRRNPIRRNILDGVLILPSLMIYYSSTLTVACIFKSTHCHLESGHEGRKILMDFQIRRNNCLTSNLTREDQ